jgi:hypothetical protein
MRVENSAERAICDTEETRQCCDCRNDLGLATYVEGRDGKNKHGQKEDRDPGQHINDDRKA